MTTLADVRDNWTTFGQRDPLYAIMTDAGKENGGWDESEFFATGVREVERYFDIVVRLTAEQRTEPLRLVRALDFGCGVGRLTQALAGLYREVVGVDISPTMLEQARKYNQRDGVSFDLNDPPDLSFLCSGSFDFILSLITLQHDEPQYQLGYLQQFMRLLRPGGVAAFQMMAEPLFKIDHPKGTPDKPVMEMHGVSIPRAVYVLRKAGGVILDIQYNKGQSEWSDCWVGLDYYVKKGAA